MTDTHTVDGITEVIESDEFNPDSTWNRAYKVGWEAASASMRKLPRFKAGLIVNERSLVVDENGHSWWVDPCGRKCVLVLDTLPKTD